MDIIINKYSKHTIPLICLSVLVGVFITSQITLRDFPNSGDEYSYLISAKLFSVGKLSVPSPNHKEFYDIFHIINDGKFYGKYSPGWPFFLMFGEFLGFPAIINMIFAILTLVVMYRLARELFSERIAKISLLLMATNSYFLFNSSSFFPHTSSQFFLLLFVYFYFKILKTEKSGSWFLLGIVLGISFLIRQLDAVVFGFCIFTHYIYFILKNKKICKDEIGKWGLFLLGFFLLFGLLLIYNYLQTGDPFLMPFVKYDPNEKLGFHYPYLASVKWAVENNIIYRIIFLNRWVPFFFVFMFLALFSSKRYSKEHLFLMFALFISILFAYFFYLFTPGNQYGPRYLYSSSFAIFILMAIGIEKVTIYKWKGYKWFLPGVLTLNIGLFIYLSILFHNQVNMRMELYDKVKKLNLSNAIVFLEDPCGSMPIEDLTRNGIYFNNSVLFVKSFDQENRLLMEDFPDRKYYLWRCDEIEFEGNKFIFHEGEAININCTLKPLIFEGS